MQVMWCTMEGIIVNVLNTFSYHLKTCKHANNYVYMHDSFNTILNTNTHPLIYRYIEVFIYIDISHENIAIVQKAQKVYQENTII